MSAADTQKMFRLVKLTKENIEPHLVLRVPASDGSVHIFNDAVIESIEKGMLQLVRPYAYVANGLIKAGTERFRYSVEQALMANFHIVMEGSKPGMVY